MNRVQIRSLRAYSAAARERLINRKRSWAKTQHYKCIFEHSMVMKSKYLDIMTLIAGVLFCLAFIPSTPPENPVIISSFGKQPTMAVDKANNLHVVFGLENEIFYTFSADKGVTFSKPEKVGEQGKLALGNTRGPQIVATDDYLVVAAADHNGRIMTYRRKFAEKVWSQGVNILKNDSTAKEGFIALAAGNNNQVYAAWLDLRVGGHNNIFSASSQDGGRMWSENKLVYEAPEGKVCPCCRPSISADKKGNVYVMFRNELEGARDLYLAHSKDGGKTFSAAEKLGTGTWMLKQCPMDGGAVSTDTKGNVGTTWRRENTVYYSEPGKAEIKIGEGRASSLVKTSKGNYLAWQQGNDIMVLMPDQLTPEILSSGTYPRLASMSDGSVMCMWESDGNILGKKLP